MNEKEKQIFEELGVKLDDLKEEKLHFLTKEMINDIINETISNIKIKPSNMKQLSTNFTLDFDSEKTKIDFEKDFRNQIFDVVNHYLENKGLDPKEYYRVISIEFGGQGVQLTMRF